LQQINTFHPQVSQRTSQSSCVCLEILPHTSKYVPTYLGGRKMAHIAQTLSKHYAYVKGLTD